MGDSHGKPHYLLVRATLRVRSNAVMSRGKGRIREGLWQTRWESQLATTLSGSLFIINSDIYTYLESPILLLLQVGGQCRAQARL